MSASYPTSVKTWPTLNNGDTVQAAHPNELREEVTAIEQDLIAGLPVARGGTGATTAAWSVDTLTFPAVQVPSGGANTLDDYEEGTWTPVIGGSGGQSGQTYAVQSGLYVKIGQLVIAVFSVQLSAKGTITNNVQISGLPFAAHATYGTTAAIGFSSLAANKVAVVAEISGGGQVALVHGIGAAASGVYTNLLTADIDNSSLFRGTLVYRAAA